MSFVVSSAVSMSESCCAVVIDSFFRCCMLASVISVLAFFRILMYSFLRLSSAPKVAHVAWALLPNGKHCCRRHSSLKAA